MKEQSSEPTVFGLIAPSLGKAGRPFAKTRSLLVMSLPVVLCPVMISAQAVSGVTGTFTDPNGAAVAGAQVTLTNTKTSRELKVTTNGEGAYTFNNVQPGAVGTNARVTSATHNANRLGSVMGSRADQGNITVDGIDANDVATGQAFATVANAPINLTDSQRFFVRATITRRDLTHTPQQFSGDEDAVALSTPRELQFAIRYDF